jgi:hypothetical protein
MTIWYGCDTGGRNGGDGGDSDDSGGSGSDKGGGGRGGGGGDGDGGHRWRWRWRGSRWLIGGGVYPARRGGLTDQVAQVRAVSLPAMSAGRRITICLRPHAPVG